MCNRGGKRRWRSSHLAGVHDESDVAVVLGGEAAKGPHQEVLLPEAIHPRAVFPDAHHELDIVHHHVLDVVHIHRVRHRLQRDNAQSVSLKASSRTRLSVDMTQSLLHWC